MVTELYDPAEHRPLDATAWSEDQARAAIEAIAGDAIAHVAAAERPTVAAATRCSPATSAWRSCCAAA